MISLVKRELFVFIALIKREETNSISQVTLDPVRVFYSWHFISILSILISYKSGLMV